MVLAVHILLRRLTLTPRSILVHSTQRELAVTVERGHSYTEGWIETISKLRKSMFLTVMRHHWITPRSGVQSNSKISINEQSHGALYDDYRIPHARGGNFLRNERHWGRNYKIRKIRWLILIKNYGNLSVAYVRMNT